MKRALIIILCVILSVAIFSGCNTKSLDKDEQGRTIISVGGWPSKEGIGLDNMNARKAEFEETNPDVSVVPDFWTFDRKSFYAKAAGNQLPTQYNVAYTEMPEIINSEYSADMTATLSKRGYDDMFNPAVLDVVSQDGKIYGYPYSGYILGIAFNTEMMSAAGLMEEDGTPKQPKDWNELAEFAVQIKQTTGKPGFVFPSSNNNGGWIFTPVAWSYGVDFMEKDENGKWQATFNTPEAVAALQYVKDLKWKYDVLPSNTLIDGTECYKTFATGNAGMMIGSSAVSQNVVQYGMLPDQLGMMGIPAGPARHVTLLGGGVSCVAPDATEDQIDASIRWVEASYGYQLTDEVKHNTERTIQDALANNELVGIKGFSIWSNESEVVQYTRGLIDSYANSNPNHVKLYNDFVANCPAEIQQEEPVCAQELYGILDSCIQEVLINENADCAELIAKAASDFQVNYLNNLEY